MSTCISADSHITEPPETYRARIAKKYLDRAPALVDDPTLGAVMVIDPVASWYRVPYGMIAGAGRPAEEIGPRSRRLIEDLHPGGFAPAPRLEAQDQDGVAAEVIYPSVGLVLCNHPDLDYQQACFDAYNLWLAEYCDFAPDRLLGVGQTAMATPDDGIRDLERIKELGLRGVMLPCVPGLEDYDSPIYTEFWAAAADLGLPVSFHILTSGRAIGGKSFRGPKIASFLAIIRDNQDVIGVLIFGGVLERNPSLRVVCVEADAGWIPHWCYRADYAHRRHPWLRTVELSRTPSQYFSDQVYATFQDDWVAFEMAHLVNPERLMWANDFPHSDSTWPDSQELLAKHTKHLTAAHKDRILGQNCAELYGLRI